MFKEHCRDEDLVSVLCGELCLFSRWKAAWHLRLCHSCRLRLENLRDDLLASSAECRDVDPVNPIVTERARRNFLAWIETCEVRFEVAKSWRHRLIAFGRVPVMAGACALVLIGGIDVWQQFHAENSEVAVEPVPQAPHRPFVQPPSVARTKESREVSEPPPLPDPIAISNPPAVAILHGPEIEEVEVSIWSVLHQAGACLGEPIEVLPQSGPGHLIVVHGIVQTRARKSQLAKRLLSSRYGEWIRVELTTTEDLITRAKRLPSREQEPHGAVTVERNVEFERALSAALKAIYPDESPDQIRRRWMNLSHAAIREVEEASSEAWAVQRVRRRFGQGVLEKLTVESRETVAAMARDHLSELRLHLDDLSKQLEPLLSKFEGERSATPAETDVFEGVERLRMEVESGMAGSARYRGSPGQLASEIIALTSYLEADLANPGDSVRRLFPPNLAAHF